MTQYRLAKYNSRWYIETSFDGGNIWAREPNDAGYKLKSEARYEMGCLQNDFTPYSRGEHNDIPDIDYWDGGMPMD